MIVFGLFLKIIDVFEFFRFFFCQFKINPHICNAYHFEKGEKARQITLLRAFFMSEALPIISYSSVPCGVLMHPQPFSRW